MRLTLDRWFTLAGVLSLVAGSAVGAASRGTIKIATQSPLSGDLAGHGGEGIRLGAELAIERLKRPIEKAGFKLELVPFDDRGEPDAGVANAKDIVADPDVLVVVGHLNSAVAIPASEVYREGGLAMISPANTNPLVTDRRLANVNRVCGRDDVQGTVAADFAADGLRAKSVYVVHDQTRYGEAIAESFQARAKARKVVVHAVEGLGAGGNVGPPLAAIKAKNPDVVFFGGEYLPAAALFRQAREKGIKSKFLGPDGLDSPELLRLGGEAVVGMHYTTVAGPAKEYPRASQFTEEYRKKLGKEPEPFAAQAYDATAIALKALEAAIKDARGKVLSRAAVARAVRKVKLAGITGSIEFDDKGDPKRAMYFVVQVADLWNENRTVKRMEMPAPGADTR